MLSTPVLRLMMLSFMAVVLGGCSSLSVLNAVLPKDRGSRLAAADLAYGPDPRQRLDVYVPEIPGPHDVLIFVNGGSWDNGDRTAYAFAGRALASKGYVTILFDYRLVPDHPYPDFVADTASAVGWAHRNAAQYGGDPNRLFLLGHSAGAYNAVMATMAPEFLRAADVPREALRGVAGLSGPYDFLPLDTSASRRAFGHVPAPDLPATQPVNRVGEAALPPMFLATGSDDTTVRPRNTERLSQRLRERGFEVTEKVYPDIGHAGMVLALSRPFRGRASVLDDVVGFFRKQ